MVNRAGDGFCRSITPVDYKAWTEITGNIVTPSEYAILHAMDVAYCTAMNEEIADHKNRQRERARQEAEANRAQAAGKRRR